MRPKLSPLISEVIPSLTNPNAHSYDEREVTEREFNPYPNPGAETATLGAQLGRLHRELSRVRRAYADLVAACRAALLAYQEGEQDPWWYLRDQLPTPPPGHPLHHHQDQGQVVGHDRDADGVGGGW